MPAALLLPDPDDPRLTQPVTGIDQEGREVGAAIVHERPLTLFLNGQEIVTVMTIGDHPEYLALGYLLNQNMLRPDDEVTAVEVEGGRATGVRLTSGDVLAADHVVVAAGARSLELLENLPDVARRIPPMVSGYGVSVLAETEDHKLPSSVVRTPNRAFACGLHGVPRGDGLLYLGATNIISARPRQYASKRACLDR